MTAPSTKKMTRGDRWVTLHNSRITWLLTLIVRFNRYSDDYDKDAELSKEMFVPANAISHTIEYAGCTIKAIQEISGAHIDIQKEGKGQDNRSVLLKGTAESIQQRSSRNRRKNGCWMFRQKKVRQVDLGKIYILSIGLSPKIHFCMEL